MEVECSSSMSTESSSSATDPSGNTHISSPDNVKLLFVNKVDSKHSFHPDFDTKGAIKHINH